MPVTVRKKKGGKYSVKTPNQTHAKSTTKAKADSQARLLRGIEHGWKPTGKKKMNTKSGNTDYEVAIIGPPLPESLSMKHMTPEEFAQTKVDRAQQPQGKEIPGTMTSRVEESEVGTGSSAQAEAASKHGRNRYK